LKKRFLSLLLLCVVSGILYGQNQKANLSLTKVSKDSISIENLPLESVNLHLNSGFLLTGENLYFTVYCQDLRTRQLSGFSKIAYLELINQEATPVYKTKVSLEGGKGWGDIYIPSSFSSGNYTLVAYTQWMRNFGPESYYQTQVTIINPFKSLPQPQSMKSSPDTLTRLEGRTRLSLSQFQNPKTILSPDKEVYSTREKVVVNLDLDPRLSGARLSVSVRKSDPEIGPLDNWNTIEMPEVEAIDPRAPQYLPDLRGDLISGSIINPTNNLPVSGITIYLSIPAKDYLFYASRTDEMGKFFFVADVLESENEILLQTHPRAGDEEIEIRLNDSYLTDYKEFRPDPLRLDSSLRELLTKRFIETQIENAYFSFKKDSVMAPPPRNRFYRKPDRIYFLDDYTRFVLMEEVIREYVGSVFLRKQDKNFILRIRNFGYKNILFQDDPLMLIDGIPVFETNVIMQMDPLKLEKIEVVGRRYFYGPLDCKGIICFETYEGDYQGFKLNQSTMKVIYQGVQPSKQYYSPKYEKNDSSNSRLPDYRSQIYWNPDISANNLIEFYTSDVEGTFEIVMRGFDRKGVPVLLKKMFEVKSPDS